MVVSFNDNVLQAICAVLGSTNDGLAGSEIEFLLKQLHVQDSDVSTKRRRLFSALKMRQDSDKCGNLVVAFIQAAMSPVRYLDRDNLFEDRRNKINEVLSFVGMTLDKEGKIGLGQQANTLDQAKKTASRRLKSQLKSRNVHSSILTFCHAELLEENCFHAVLEACKSLAQAIRDKASLRSDGANLIDDAFGLGSAKMPLLAFNSLQTESEESEHKGIMNLLKGLFGAFRNPHSHAPKISWPISEQEALDILTMISFLLRRIDGAVVVPRKT